MTYQERGVADVPVEDRRVTSLLDAAAAPSEPGPQPGEAEVLAAFRASRPTPRRSPMHSTRTRTKVALAGALGAGLLLTGGVGAAAAGSLPGAAQNTASEMLAAVGIEVPGADEHSAGHSDQRGKSDERPPATEDETSEDSGTTSTDEAQGENSGKGAAVSELARTTESEGVDKGAEISGLASEGRSQAGQHGGAEGDDARPEGAGDAGQQGTTQQPPVEAPNHGGTGTADDASTEHADGASTAGTDTADEESTGHSSAGSDNRP